MTQHTTQLHLVPDLATAFEVARGLEAEATLLDMEGVAGNYVGNDPRVDAYQNFLYGHGRENMLLIADEKRANPDTPLAIATNNTNQPYSNSEGLVSRVADNLGIPYAHKGMRTLGGVVLKGKPEGDQCTHLTKKLDVNPARSVLIDDQGVKNTGEAVNAGLMAIIVPDPIGLPREDGRVEEYKWVRRARTVEPVIYRSLQKEGWLARVAYSKLAGIDIASIGEFHDHRVAA